MRTGGDGAAGFVGAGFACSRGATSNVATSWTRMRPSGSCVATCAKSIPFSRASLRAAGEAIGRSATDVLSVAAAATGCSAFSSAFGVSFGASCDVCVTAGVGASPPAEMTAIVSPTRTVSPSAAITSVNVPASSDGTSMLTLSVSSSTMASPFSTWSPGCLSHVATVPSVMDSANSGTLISITMSSPLTYLRSFWYVLVPAAAETASREIASRMMRACSCLWAVGFPSAGLERRRRPT